MTFESAIQRAAVLVKSLSQPQARKLLSHLDAADLKAIFKRMRSLDELTDKQRVDAAEKLLGDARQYRSTFRSDATQETKPSVESGPFGFLIETTDSIRFVLLENEHPTCIATVISFLPSKMASDLLNQFTANARVAILRRLCRTEKFDAAIVAVHSARLRQQMQKMLDSEKYNQRGIVVATRLLSCTDTLTRNKLIDCLEEQDPELASEIQSDVMNFTSLLSFTDNDIKTILKWVDTSLWAPAIKNASHPLARKVLNNLAERPRAILKREIKSIGRVDSLISDRARTEIIKTCLQLIDRRLIQYPASKRKAG